MFIDSGFCIEGRRSRYNFDMFYTNCCSKCVQSVFISLETCLEGVFKITRYECILLYSTEKFYVCGFRLCEELFLFRTYSCYIYTKLNHHNPEKEHVNLLLQIGWHSPLNTVQSVDVYSLAFPLPSGFYTHSPSCHDTQAFHKYSWYL